MSVLLFTAALGAVLYDLWSGTRSGVAQWIGTPADAPYRAELTFDRVKYSDLDRSVTAAVSIAVRATDPDVEVDSVVFRLAPNAHGQWDLLRSASCTLTEHSDEPVGEGSLDGPEFCTKRFSCGDVALGHPPGADERAYPFDRYQIRLAPGGCANDGRSVCVQSRHNLAFTSLSARSELPTLAPEFSRTDSPVLTLQRRPFVQHLSLVLAAMSAVFFVLLCQVGDRKDLFAKSLGFYGTLWALRSLLVPPSVTAFPTYVDYFVLTLFAITFAVILYRLPTIQGEPT